MTANEMHMLARESNDKKIEGVYVEELNIIYDAAKAGNFYVDSSAKAIFKDGQGKFV